MLIEVTFSDEWIYGADGIHASAVRQFIDKCQTAFGDRVQVLGRTLTGCTLKMDDEPDQAELNRQLSDILKTVSKCGPEEKIYSLTVAGEAVQPKPADQPDDLPDSGDLTAQITAQMGKSDPVDAKAAPEPTPSEPAQGAMDEIEARIENDDFKALCREIKQRAPVIREKKSHVFFSEAYLLAADEGSGYNSALKLFNRLLTEEGIFENPVGIDTLMLPDPKDGEVDNKMLRLTDTAQKAISTPRILLLDIGKWVGDTASPLFKRFLLELFRGNTSCVLVFRTPLISRDTLEKVNRDLNDIISTRPIVFRHFSQDGLRRFASNYLKEQGYTLAEDAWDVFDALIDAEKQDGFFYEVYTVRKVINSFIHCAEMKNCGTDQIERQTIASLLPETADSAQDSLFSLQNMVGMTEIKERVREITSQIIYARRSGMSGSPCMHMCFTGNPGTGKTTVARAIGSILKEQKILRVGDFYEHHARDLCGKFVGHTAPLTKSICEKAYGSVLFIDEAYSLVSGHSDNDFGKEAVDVLIAEMENHKDDMMVIFAGYPEEMNALLDMNSGLRDRVPYKIHFPNYTAQQLNEIFARMVKGQFQPESGFDENAKRYFLSIPESVLNSKTFGNARFVRNIYERTWGKAVLRCGNALDAKPILTIEDFNEAVKEFPLQSEAKRNTIGFSS